jgi:alkaline phosphatase D
VIEFSTSPLNQFFEPFSRYHREVEDTDVSIFNYPWGNSKFGFVKFDTSDPLRLELGYKLVVDEQEVWTYQWTMLR